MIICKIFLQCVMLFFLFTIPGISSAEEKNENLKEDFFSNSFDSPFKVSPVVSVVISGTNDSHIKEVLSSAVSLSRKVPVRNVVIIANAEDMQRFSAHQEEAFRTGELSVTKEQQEMLEKLKVQIPKNPFLGYFRDLKLMPSGFKSGDKLKERLRISHSPTWVVRFEGKDYIYEGYPNIARMFDAKGGFRPE
ncbi:MAG TPA: hypothetical protein PKA63_02210 [Oligoflexia bacterium]|nr:hypothetical protein [Oligoflexia bacterium]HMP47465.1 hypothetical protein [Oligoflexia bacterium]